MAAQLPDIIVINGVRQELYSNPLEQFWIVKKIRRPFFLASTICKRGYVATWEIIDKHLVLKDIEGQFEKRYLLFWRKICSFSIRNLFKNISVKDEIASWYTGKIRVPIGKRIWYVHKDYESRFEKEMILTVDHGKIIKTIVLDYTHETLTVTTRELFQV
jgi:hypothetical protein